MKYAQHVVFHSENADSEFHPVGYGYAKTLESAFKFISKPPKAVRAVLKENYFLTITEGDRLVMFSVVEDGTLFPVTERTEWQDVPEWAQIPARSYQNDDDAKNLLTYFSGIDKRRLLICLADMTKIALDCVDENHALCNSALVEFLTTTHSPSHDFSALANTTSGGIKNIYWAIYYLYASVRDSAYAVHVSTALQEIQSQAKSAQIFRKHFSLIDVLFHTFALH